MSESLIQITFVYHQTEYSQITAKMPTVPQAGDFVDISNSADGVRICGKVKFRRFFYFADQLTIDVVVEPVISDLIREG